jgi:hypothetical protein
LSVDAATDSAGNDQIFAVLADGNAYHLVGGANHQAYSWVQLSQSMTLHQIEVETDDSGNVQAFAVSGDNQIYHWEPEAASQTGYSYPPASIATGVALVGAAADDAGAIDLFAVGTAQSTLTHLFQEEVSTNWVSEPIEVPTSGEVEQYISYTSDVGIYDAAGAVMINQPVNLWTAEESLVTINGATYFTGPNTPARTSTNGAGTLSIAQEVGSLAVPAVQLNVPSLMQPGQSIAIEQYAGVQSTLAAVTGPDLMNAHDASGNYLIPDPYRTPGTTASMATAFNNCMALAGTAPADAVRLATRRGARPGVWWRSAGGAADLRRVATPRTQLSWRLAFSGGAVTYQALSAGEAQALLAQKRASILAAGGFFDWLDDVGDFLEGVVDAVIDIVDTVVTTVGNAINAAFTFIVDGVTYLFETVITVVEQAFDVVEAFFAQVGVVFEKIFEWLGFLFDWDDMLRTHQAIAYTVNQFFSFLQGGAAGIQAILDNGIDNLQGQIATLFQNAIANIAGTASVGGYEKSNQQPSPALDSAVSNNVLYNGVIDNASGATSAFSAALLADDSPITQFITQVEQFVDANESSTAFTNAVTYFQNLGGSPDQIFGQLLAGLFEIVEGILQAILSGVQAVVDALLGIVQTLIGSLQALLNASWDIPFVSQFYSWITNGATLTTIDLIALVAAIPATLLYKILYDAAPFPDAASVTAFESSFSAQTMLQASGLGAGGGQEAALAAATSGGMLSSQMAQLMGVMGAVATFFYGAFSAILDAIPKGAPSLLAAATFVCETAAQGCAFPWFTLSGAPDCTTADGTAMTLWIYQCFGILLDLAFLLGEGTIPENWNDAGVGITFFYGVGHLVVAIIASVPAEPVNIAAMILPVIPELAKLCRLTQIVAATEGISLAVIAGVDFLFYLASAILNSIASNSTETDTAFNTGESAQPLLAIA